jgi:hypothetical protein
MFTMGMSVCADGYELTLRDFFKMQGWGFSE